MSVRLRLALKLKLANMCYNFQIHGSFLNTNLSKIIVEIRIFDLYVCMYDIWGVNPTEAFLEKSQEIEKIKKLIHSKGGKYGRVINQSRGLSLAIIVSRDMNLTIIVTSNDKKH